MTDYPRVNRANWDERAAAHAASADYGFARFTEDPDHLHPVVRFDRPLLGDISGLRGVHLQCHIGTDTVSLGRLGATMTGVDFSGESLAVAVSLAAAAGAEGATFDLVYTGIGALCRRPDIRRWARTVAALLRPGGRPFIREGHPVLWSLDYDRTDGLIVLAEPYFEQTAPQLDDIPGTYVETDVTFEHTATMEWNHGIGEIVTALLGAGMTITGLVEHQTVPGEALPGRMTLRGDEWQLTEKPERLPQAVRTAV